MPKAAKTPKLPGSIYARAGRYWWNVRLPGEQKRRARALVPEGGTMATNDPGVAEAIARDMWTQATVAVNKTDGGEHDVATLAGLVATYMEYARDYYRDVDGHPTGEARNLESGLRVLSETFPSLRPEEFAPFHFKTVRSKAVAKGCNVSTANGRASMVKRMFAWAVEEGLAPASTWHALLAIKPLKGGQRVDGMVVGKAKDVKPVAEHWVYKTADAMTPTARALTLVTLLTAMRPTEVCTMRPCDINRSGEIWYYAPEHHKLEHRKQNRTVQIGPKAQAVLEPMIARCVQARGTTGYIFTPAESEAERLDANHAARTTPESCGNRRGTNCKGTRAASFRPRFDAVSFRTMVMWSIAKANRRIEKAYIKEVDAEERELTDAEQATLDARKVPAWFPYQLLHTGATLIRRALGRDHARAVLGHKTSKVTDDYAEIDESLATEAAKQVG
jgi:integrase